VKDALSGPYGGDQQIGCTKIASGQIDLSDLLCVDPLDRTTFDEPDISAAY